MRPRRKGLDPGDNFEDSVEPSDFKYVLHKLADVHQFQTDAFCFGLLTQRQHQPQAARVNGADSRQIQNDCAGIQLRIDCFAQGRRFTVNDSSLQTNNSHVSKISCVYFQHNQTPLFQFWLAPD